MDVRVSGMTWDDRQRRPVPYSFIAEHLGTDERTGRAIVLHPVHGRQQVRDDETVEEVPLSEALALAVPSDLCILCGKRNDEGHHGMCEQWADDTSIELLTGQITVAVPGEQMELGR